MRLEDRVAIVTGGGLGIGRGIAQRFVEEGARVVIADRDLHAAQAAADTIVVDRTGVLVIEMDVRYPEDVQRMVDTVLEQYGQIDILVNNAGLTGRILGRHSFLDISLEVWQAVIAVNLTGAFLCSQACARMMAVRHYGRIINIGSINSLAAEQGVAHYVASKSGIAGLTRAMAVDLAEYGILVNCIAPGAVLTEHTRTLVGNPEYRKVIERTALKRAGEPTEIGSLAAFLASEECSYMTGETLVVDGGYLPLLG